MWPVLNSRTPVFEALARTQRDGSTLEEQAVEKRLPLELAHMEWLVPGALARVGGRQSYWCSRSEDGRQGVITLERTDPCGHRGIHLEILDRSNQPVGVAPSTSAREWHNVVLNEVVGQALLRSMDEVSLAEALIIT